MLLKPLLTVVAAFCTIIFLTLPAHAANERNLENRMIFDWHDQNSPSTGAPPSLSFYKPAPTDYGNPNEMTGDDRKVALAQMLVDIVGYNLEASKVGKVLLGLREPVRGSKAVACSQRFTASRYFLRCKLKF